MSCACSYNFERFAAVLVQKAQQLAQLGIPLAERVLLPFILEVTRGLQTGLAWAGKGREVSEGRYTSQFLLV